jgi:hypothetical protein
VGEIRAGEIPCFMSHFIVIKGNNYRLCYTINQYQCQS